MEWRRLGLCLLVVLWLGGCATNGGLRQGETLSVGQRETDLVARKGQPQEVLPEPGGGKIYVYTTLNLDQVAAMGGGAWAKPDQVYYWLDNQGVITRVTRYPYGKRKFLFPSEEKPTRVAQAAEPQAAQPPVIRAAPPAPPVTTQTAPAPAAPAVAAPEKAPKPPAAPAPEKLARPVPTPAPAAVAEPAPRVAAKPPAASPAPTARTGKEAATQLELNMTREEVRRVLGLPERTEGFQAGGRAVIVWYYLLEERQGRRVVTPLVFENGRLSGWGDNHYRRLLREISGQKP